MQHVGRVDVFQAAERLVDEGLEVRVRERLAGSDLMKDRQDISGKDKEGSINARWRGGRPP